MTKKFDPKHAAAHGYARADWDATESPEMTGEELAAARPFAEALPDPGAAMDKVLRGRPPLANPKVVVSIRLDADLVARLKEGGRGWQTRLNATLRKAVGL